MINLHFLTIDPLIENTSPSAAVKVVENVLQAVDVPIAIGGCGDPNKDLAVFTAIAEATKGERLLINSITLDMDIEKSAKMIKDNDHVAIAFTSMDVNKARELNRKLYDYLPKDQHSYGHHNCCPRLWSGLRFHGHGKVPPCWLKG